MENIKLNNGKQAIFKYFSDFDNPIFIIDDKYKVTIIDDKLYSVFGDDEPSCPLKEEYQSEIFIKYTYNFFKGCFIER